MVRPKASEENRQLALSFGRLVTVEDESSRVSRAGEYSIFEVFAKCFPWAVRKTESDPRNGLTISQFNKALEQQEFEKIRKAPPRPSADASENFADPNNANYTGSYAFAKRRWRDPADSRDRRALIDGAKNIEQEIRNTGQEMVSEDKLLALVQEAQEKQSSTPVAGTTPVSGTPSSETQGGRKRSPVAEESSPKRRRTPTTTNRDTPPAGSVAAAKIPSSVVTGFDLDTRASSSVSHAQALDHPKAESVSSFEGEEHSSGTATVVELEQQLLSVQQKIAEKKEQLQLEMLAWSRHTRSVSGPASRTTAEDPHASAGPPASSFVHAGPYQHSSAAPSLLSESRSHDFASDAPAMLEPGRARTHHGAFEQSLAVRGSENLPPDLCVRPWSSFVRASSCEITHHDSTSPAHEGVGEWSQMLPQSPSQEAKPVPALPLLLLEAHSVASAMASDSMSGLSIEPTPEASHSSLTVSGSTFPSPLSGFTLPLHSSPSLHVQTSWEGLASFREPSETAPGSWDRQGSEMPAGLGRQEPGTFTEDAGQHEGEGDEVETQQHHESVWSLPLVTDSDLFSSEGAFHDTEEG